MPRLQRLCLNHIDLIQGRWEGVIESMRWASWPWELLSFQGPFRHKDDEWWPWNPEEEGGVGWKRHNDWSDYIKYGGRHPSLPPDYPEICAVAYVNYNYAEAGGERHQSFFRHRQEFYERHMLG